MGLVKNGISDKSLRVLLLEDSETDAELIRYVLQTTIPGLQLRQVDTREDFVRELGEFAPQIVLADYSIPGFDGLCALKTLRAARPDLPFIVVSGALGDELAVALLKAGATDYILKDRMSRLPSAVERALEEAQRSAELRKKSRLLAQEVEVRRRTEQDLLNSQRDLRRLALELSRAEDSELRRISMEIHDRIGQNLVLVLMDLENLRIKVRESEELGSAIALLDTTIQEMRSLALELSPPILYEFGIFSALEWLAERLREKEGISITIQAGQRHPLPPQDLQLFLYKSVREMIRNSIRHAAAKNIIVRIGIGPDGVYAEVEDDGPGFEPSLLNDKKEAGLGLFSIRERLSHMGGRLHIGSGSGGGSRLRITVPANVSA